MDMDREMEGKGEEEIDGGLMDGRREGGIGE